MILFSAPNHSINPGVLVFAKVCLDCGASRFCTPTKELRSLREGAALSTAGNHDGRLEVI